MAIQKQPFPILEYDANPKAVLNPDYAKLSLQLPEKCVFAFLNETIEQTAAALGARVVGYYDSITKPFPVYVCSLEGEAIALMQAPLGASAATHILDWLIAYGVTTIISSGSCGTLKELPANVFLVTTKALRDEGTSYHYLPPARSIDLHRDMIRAIQKTFKEEAIPYLECMTWTTDGFFRETPDMVRYRAEEGCAVVEMECAALAACAEFRGARFGQIFFTGDTLAQADRHEVRDFGHSSYARALELCLKILRNC